MCMQESKIIVAIENHNFNSSYREVTTIYCHNFIFNSTKFLKHLFAFSQLFVYIFFFHFSGCFNVTVKGHAKCVEFMKKYNLPLMLLGGGGYTIRNVARCWTYETAVALGTEIANELPYNDYFEYFGPDFKLHISPSNMTNQNTPEYMDKIK